MRPGDPGGIAIGRQLGLDADECFESQHGEPDAVLGRGGDQRGAILSTRRDVVGSAKNRGTWASLVAHVPDRCNRRDRLTRLPQCRPSHAGRSDAESPGNGTQVPVRV